MPSAASSGGLGGALLEAELGRTGAALGVLVAAILGARAGALGHGAVGALVAGTVVAGAAFGLLARRARIGDLLLVSVVAASLALGGLGPLASLAPFVAQAPGRGPLLALRGFLVLVTLFRAAPAPEAGPDGARRARLVQGLVVALFLASLVVEAALVPAILVTAVAVRLAAARPVAPPAAAPRWLAPTVAAAALLVAVAPSRPAGPAEAPRSPAEAVPFWRARGNPYRARAVALAWAEKERPPGEGFLTLAEIDWELGEKTKARKVLAKVLAADTSRELHERAEALARSWTEAP